MCDDCIYYVYDEDEQDYFCTADMDQDDLAALMNSNMAYCPDYRMNDEYAIVRHQM